MSVQKLARYFDLPMVMDQEAEDAYLRAQTALDVRSKELLETSPVRIRAAREAGRDDPEQYVYDQDRAELEPLEKARDEAKKGLDAVTVTYRFRALGRKSFRALVKTHPPTDAQIAEAKAEGDEKLSFNADTFPRELVRKALIRPSLSAEDVDEMYDGGDWNATELTLLFQGALQPQTNAGMSGLV